MHFVERDGFVEFFGELLPVTSRNGGWLYLGYAGIPDVVGVCTLRGCICEGFVVYDPSLFWGD